jgi:hypothetical protein
MGDAQCVMRDGRCVMRDTRCEVEFSDGHGASCGVREILHPAPGVGGVERVIVESGDATT